ncbi:MAG TPA: hypothetical protein VF915_11000 [Reyranella sp.]
MRVFVTAVTLLALCGCLPPAVEAGQPSAQLGPPRSGDPTDLCSQQMLASAEHQALKSKLPPLEPGSLPSQAQQADPTLATPQEAKLVLSYHQKYVVPCRQEGLIRSSAIGPQVVVILVESFAKSDANYLKLVERKMSWGEYNREVHALRVDTRARLAAAASRQNNPGLEDLAQDARQRQAAMIALENWKRQQQALVQKQRQLNPGDPARLNDCTYPGATVTCTSL